MKLKKSIVALAAAALVATGLSACSSSGGQEIVPGSAVNIAWNQDFYSANGQTSNGNATANNNILYMANSAFNYYDDKQTLIKNEKFGKYELVSQSPLTIKYTVNDGVKWSDGVPVDAADMLLSWAANSCHFNNVKPAYDANGAISNQAALDAGVFFDSVSCGADLSSVTKVPTIGDNGRSLTLVYDQPKVDWELDFAIGVPAHVTAMNAFKSEGLTAQQAKDRLVKAVQDGDVKTLAPIAKFWSSGFDVQNYSEADPSIFVGDGAYTITDLVAKSHVTLTANPSYSWGEKPQIEKVTVRTIEDAMASVTALENGEVDAISPQATADITTALSKDTAKGIVVNTTSDATYEHIDLTLNNKGPFDPATYGGDAQKAKNVRLAFLKTIPRQDILDKLIKPINPAAVLDNSQTILPGAPGYDAMASANGSADFATPDIAGAKQLLTQAGVTGKVAIKFMFGCGNTRRQNEFALIQASAAQAGFDVLNKCDDNWGSLLGSGSYDATVFGWQSTSTAVNASSATFLSDGGNNFTGYKNDAVDAAYKSLAGEFDATKQKELLTTVEKNLFADGYGVTVFQFPGVTAFNSKKISGITPAPLAPMFFWNYWTWKQLGGQVNG